MRRVRSSRASANPGPPDLSGLQHPAAGTRLATATGEPQATERVFLVTGWGEDLRCPVGVLAAAVALTTGAPAVSTRARNPRHQALSVFGESGHPHDLAPGNMDGCYEPCESGDPDHAGRVSRRLCPRAWRGSVRRGKAGARSCSSGPREAMLRVRSLDLLVDVRWGSLSPGPLSEEDSSASGDAESGVAILPSSGTSLLDRHIKLERDLPMNQLDAKSQ